MTQQVLPALVALIIGGVGGGFLSLFFYKRQEKWNSLRQAGMKALSVVDAVQSNMNWNDLGSGSPIRVEPQPIDIALAREALNELSLTCSNPAVISQYMAALGIGDNGVRGDAIMGFREALRKELGFGKRLTLDKSQAFIAAFGSKGTH